MPPEMRKVLTTDKLSDLFEWMDVDEGGTLSKEEFTEGVCDLALLEVPLELLQILVILRKHTAVLADSHMALHHLRQAASVERRRDKVEEMTRRRDDDVEETTILLNKRHVEET